MKPDLTATRQAHRTGARTTNEWLGAEHDAAQAELAVMQLRIQTTMDQLRLSAASGELGEISIPSPPGVPTPPAMVTVSPPNTPVTPGVPLSVAAVVPS